MPKLRIFLLTLFVAAQVVHADAVHLRTNSLETPLGIDTPRPTFSWQSDAKTPNWMQSAYEILVATDAKNLLPGKADAWDSGKTKSSESVNITYDGAAIKSQQRYFWKVVTWNEKGISTTSAPAWFETGLLNAADWKAQWITRKDPAAEQEMNAIRWIWLPNSDAMHVASSTPAFFQYYLHLTEVPIAASLHVLARGQFTARVNGQVTGHHSEWGAFDREEIAHLLHVGDNEIEVAVVSHKGGVPPATSPSAFAASIRVTHPDGKEDRIVTNEQWQVRATPDGAWQSAQTVGPLALRFGIGTDRQQAIPGPDRVTTDASLLRKNFNVNATILSARLSITALGAYQAFINGKSVAPNTLLAPGWTDFHKRVLYQTYDVTKLLSSGANTIGVLLGGGWYSSPMTWAGVRIMPGPNLLRAQLELTFANGTHQTIVTDPSWSTAPAPITFSEIYGGESYDARLAQHAWNTSNYDAARWTPAVSGAPPDESMALTAQPDLPINSTITLRPVKLDPANEKHPRHFRHGPEHGRKYSHTCSRPARHRCAFALRGAN